MMTDLTTVLTNEFYNLMVEAWLPFDKAQQIDFSESINKLFCQENDAIKQLQPKLWLALEALSKLGLENIPNLMSFLPSVEDPYFPLQSLGLQLLLDQAPRTLFRGIDIRYTYAYFDEISIRYAKRLQAEPQHLNPSSWIRWKDSVTIDYFVLVRLFYGAPFVHHERMADQALEFTNATREFVEKVFAVRDPNRDQPRMHWDLYGFPKMMKRIRDGEPKSPCGVADGWFFLAHLMDVHYPLLKKFGRYPYQNGALGRDTTPEEDEWMHMSGFFRESAPDVKKRIRDDVENGRWTPLGAGRE